MNINRYIELIKHSFSLVYKNARNFFVIYIIKTIISAGRIYLTAWLSKALFNSMVLGITQGVLSHQIIVTVCIILAIEVIISFSFKILDYYSDKSLIRFNDYISITNSQKVEKLRFEFHDNPNNNNELRQFLNDSKSIQDLFSQIVSLSVLVISFVVSLIIGIRFNILVTLFAVVVSVPGLFIRNKIKNDGYETEKKLNLHNRKIEYFKSIFSSKGNYEELHMFNIQSFFYGKMKGEMNIRATEMDSLRKRRTKRELFIILIYSFANIVINLMLVGVIILKRLTIGDYTYYNTIINNLKNNSDGFVSNLNEILISLKKVDNYYSFLESDNEYKRLGDNFVEPVNKLEFVNVSFKYPNSDVYVLKNVSFTVKENEKIALAGINGAGKTTLINLLIRFYKPTEGKILINGKDINEINIEDYWKLYSVMFQKANLYHITVKENLLVSNMSYKKEVDYSTLNTVIEKLDLSFLVPSINKMVGKTFDKDGVIFSPGQSQKINIAKTLLRNSPIIIFDEPSSAMDAIAEDGIMRDIFEVSKNKILFFVSHRLNNLKNVDKIIFLEEGQVVEIGSHEELIKNKSFYYNMYSIQSKKYL